jgi:multidrug efflux pump subunit AcrA (membrane-fusion protein)
MLQIIWASANIGMPNSCQRLRMRVSPAVRHVLDLVRCVALAFGLSSTQAPAADGPPPPQVTVAYPKASLVPRWDEYTGRFEPLQQVEVRPR